MLPGKSLRVLLLGVAAIALIPTLATLGLLAALPDGVRRGWLDPEAGQSPVMLAAAVGIGFALAALVGLLYAWRLRGALGRLRRAMNRVAGRDFSVRIDPQEVPGTASLLRAFNSMAEQLGHRVAELEAGAEIDRAILVNADVERIASTLIQRVPALVPCDAVALAVLVETDSRPEGRLFVGLASRRTPPSIGRFELSSADIVEVKAVPGETVLGPAQPPPALAARLAEAGCRSIAIFPIEWNGLRMGLLLVGARDPVGLQADGLGRVRQLLSRVSDALAGATREERQYAAAHFDQLTGLPNRLLLKDRLVREVSRAQRDHRELAVLVCDLDRFREVGRMLGDGAAEQALQQVAARLRACLRESDTAARTRGDEFAVLLPDLASAYDAGMVADAVVRAIAQPLQVASREVFVTVSVGVAVYPYDGSDGPELLRHADMAMCRAKAGGRNRHVFFEERMNREAIDRARAQDELQLALERGELVLHFQPQVDLGTGEVIGAEALLRWRHPERGVILPREFLPAAEQSGLITRIGYWVVEEVGRIVDGWRTQGVAAPRVMVNVSLRQFRDPAFPDAVRFSMQRWGLARGSMGFEIAESALLDDPETVVRALSQLKALGTLVSIEDFGLRRSSLSLLTRLPYDLIKVDRTFVRDIARDTESASLVRAIIAIAHQFGKQVIAEGIEADTQREFLRHHGCNLAQGILIGRPLPAPEFLSYLVSQRLLRSSAERAKKLVER